MISVHKVPWVASANAVQQNTLDSCPSSVGMACLSIVSSTASSFCGSKSSLLCSSSLLSFFFLVDLTLDLFCELYFEVMV